MVFAQPPRLGFAPKHEPRPEPKQLVLGRSLEEIRERWVVGGDRMLDEETA